MLYLDQKDGLLSDLVPGDEPIIILRGVDEETMVILESMGQKYLKLAKQSLKYSPDDTNRFVERAKNIKAIGQTMYDWQMANKEKLIGIKGERYYSDEDIAKFEKQAEHLKHAADDACDNPNCAACNLLRKVAETGKEPTAEEILNVMIKGLERRMAAENAG